MGSYFYKIYTYFHDKKIAFIGLLSLVAVGMLLIALNLNLEENISKLIPKSEDSETLNKVLENVDFSDKIIVNIYSKDSLNADQLTEYASELIDSLNASCSDFIASIQGEISDDNMSETFDFLYQHLPLFLDAKDYQSIANKIHPDSIPEYIKGNYKTLISPTGLFAKKIIRKDPFGMSFMALKKLEELKISDDFDVYNGFLLSKDKKNVLLFIKPALASNETDGNTDFVAQLYEISAALNAKYEGVAFGEYYGSTVIAVANASQIKHDIRFTVSIAMGLLLIILVLFYRKIYIPLVLFTPTVLAALSALVVLYFLRNEISAISIGIGSVLLGITLDFSLHILTHYRSIQDPKKLYQTVTLPILMSSFTTAVAFLCLVFLKSQALQDLGIFAAVSVLSSSFFALIAIPILFNPKTKEKESKKSNVNILERLAGFDFHKSKIAIAILVALLITSAFTYSKVSFDKDLSKMNYQEPETLLAEQHLEDILNLSSRSVYLVSYGSNESEVLLANSEINTILKKQKEAGNILSYSSIGALVLSEDTQNEKIAKWKDLWNAKAKDSLKSRLINGGTAVGFDATTYEPFYKLIDEEYAPLGIGDYKTIKSFFVGEFINVDSDFKTAVSIVKLEEGESESLEMLIKEIPNTILVDRSRINETFLGGLHDNFSTLINYSLLAVFLILLLFYRKLGLTVFTMVPIIVTWFITLGIMGVLGIQFTIFNVIISTFIFGLGIDYSIFMTNALIEDYTYGTKEVTTYKVSIVLSVITTILGIGVLIFAKHPSLISIASLCLIGIVISPLVTFIVQPLLFNFLVGRRVKKGYAPLEFLSFFVSIYSLTLYISGGLLLSLFSMVLLPIIPLAKASKIRRMHKMLASLQRAIIYTNPLIKKRIVNIGKEDFKKPAIIIANHSSSIDVIIIGAVADNIAFIVNDWVYKSAIFGKMAQALGFFPVSKGVEEGIAQLQEKVDAGYSLMIFPEGTRSKTNKVERFHKGAFYMQEQLKLDILPLYYHGNAELMIKNDFVMNKGTLTLKVGERIAYNDKSFGNNARERTKNISTFYKKELLKLRTELEGVDYFKRILFANYSFKEAAIQKQVKQDFISNKQAYLELTNYLPMKTRILHLGHDYGQIDILLLSKSIDRKITSLLQDDTIGKIAKNCYVTQYRKCKYVHSLAHENIEHFDYLLLSHVDQINTLKRLDVPKGILILAFNINSVEVRDLKLKYSTTEITASITLLSKL